MAKIYTSRNLLSEEQEPDAVSSSAPVKVLHYFCDESSQSDDTFMAVAGVAVAREAIPYILEKMNAIRQKFGKQGEVKWKNAKSRNGVVHEAYIRLLFDLIAEGRLHFHIRFSRMDEYDHKLSGPRRRIDTVSKAFFQLLLHRPMAFYGPKVDLHIFPDDGCCTEELPGQLEALNRAALDSYSARPAKVIQPRASDKEPLLQLLDCTLGALAAYRNGRHELSEISEVKRRLAVLAFELTKWPDITGNCHKGKKKTSRWNSVPSIKSNGRDQRG